MNVFVCVSVCTVCLKNLNICVIAGREHVHALCKKTEVMLKQFIALGAYYEDHFMQPLNPLLVSLVQQHLETTYLVLTFWRGLGIGHIYICIQ